MRKLTIAGLAIVLFCIGFYFYSCRNNDLRGWWKISPDGKTYLVIEGVEGELIDPPCNLNGQPWPHRYGQAIEIEPGAQELRCPLQVGFEVRPGVVYHFDYWGP